MAGVCVGVAVAALGVGADAAVNVAAFRSVAGVHTKTAFSSNLYVHFGRFCPGQREMYIRKQTFS